MECECLDVPGAEALATAHTCTCWTAKTPTNKHSRATPALIQPPPKKPSTPERQKVCRHAPAFAALPTPRSLQRVGCCILLHVGYCRTGAGAGQGADITNGRCLTGFNTELRGVRGAAKPQQESQTKSWQQTTKPCQPPNGSDTRTHTRQPPTRVDTQLLLLLLWQLLVVERLC